MGVRRHPHYSTLRVSPQLVPAVEIRDPDVRELAQHAESFVATQRWCVRVTNVQLAFAVAGVLGVFQIDLQPASANVDSRVWAVVGDLPPAYIAYENNDTWQDALAGYVNEMDEWVSAAREGRDVSELIPVSVPPTTEHADLLAPRLWFIRERLLAVDPDTLESDV